MWPFKKRCKGQHFKEAGYSFPENMKLVLKFWSGQGDHDYHQIFQCEMCGKRAFMGLLPPQPTIEQALALLEERIKT